MSRFVIHGGRPLQGEIRASGSKNAVLPMIAAALLSEEEIVLENVPSIRDVDVMLEIAGELGAAVSRVGDRISICAANLNEQELPADLCEGVRTSVLFVAPLLHRLGRAKLHRPGGDGIGRRRLDPHFYGLRLLGVEVDDVEFEFKARDGLSGATIFFDEASVTATEHILMAATLATGTTTIRNAASEPHVMDLASMLVSMGAQIDGLYTNTLVITGVDKLSGTTHRVVSDHIEVGSYLALAAATGGGITIHDTVRGHYWMMNRVFERFGIELDIQADRIVMASGQRPRIEPDAGGAVPQVADGPWPQFPT
ncbi:MAG: UDP-N-acetylglucosamine 1-carboxyvinyltransferase, partial [Myxococcota bacterium]